MRAISIATVVLVLTSCDPGEAENPQPGDTRAGGDTSGSCVPTWVPGTPDPTSAAQWCDDFYTAYCHRAFTDCSAELTVPAKDEPACVTQMTSMCSTGDWSETVYVDADAIYCLEVMTNAACSTFEDGGLEGCNSRIGLRGILPDPSTCVAIGPGTHTGELTGGEPTYAAYETLGLVSVGKPARTYCLCATAGDVLSVSLAPGSTNPLGEYADLHLLNPFGSIDTAGFYSGGSHYPTIDAFTVGWTGAHTIVVTPQSATGDTGTFELTVTLD